MDEELRKPEMSGETWTKYRACESGEGASQLTGSGGGDTGKNEWDFDDDTTDEEGAGVEHLTKQILDIQDEVEEPVCAEELVVPETYQDFRTRLDSVVLDLSSSGDSTSSPSSNSMPGLESEGTTDEEIMFAKLTASELSAMTDDIWGFGGVDFFLRMHSKEMETAPQGQDMDHSEEENVEESSDEYESASGDERANLRWLYYKRKYKIETSDSGSSGVDSANEASGASGADEHVASTSRGMRNTRIASIMPGANSVFPKKLSKQTTSGAKVEPMTSTPMPKSQSQGVDQHKTGPRQRNSSRAKKPAAASSSSGSVPKTGQGNSSKKDKKSAQRRKHKKRQEKERLLRKKRNIGWFASKVAFMVLVVAVMTSIMLREVGRQPRPDFVNKVLEAKDDYARRFIEED